MAGQTPNPNVLVEYGWALKSLTHSRILPVMNTAFGEPTAETMPFDMIHLRHPTTYNCPADATEESRRQEREMFAKELERKIREILESDEFQASFPTAAKAPVFPRQEPKDGAARFRSRGEPLGIAERSWGRDAQEIKLSDGPAMWLRLMPGLHPGREWQISDLRKVATEGGVSMPLCRAVLGYGHVRAHDGFGVYGTDTPSNNTGDVVFLFTTGEIWTADTYDLRAAANANAIPFVENDFSEALESYSKLLTRLGVTPPFTWIAGMEGIKGRGICVPDRPGYSSFLPGPRGKCLVDSVIVEGRHSPDEAPTSSLKPFFTKVFDSCGIERPGWLDARK